MLDDKSVKDEDGEVLYVLTPAERCDGGNNTIIMRLEGSASCSLHMQG